MNFENGKKYHQSAREMQMVKEYSNQLCMEYGLSVTETKADRKRIPKWKKDLRFAIREAKKQTRTPEEFIETMNVWGYDVKWEPGQKYITYTTPENFRCRDNKLFDDHSSARTWSATSRWAGVIIRWRSCWPWATSWNTPSTWRMTMRNTSSSTASG